MQLLIVAGQSLVIFLFLVLILFRLGRSLMAGVNPFQYMIVALLGSSVETGLYNGSDRLSAGLVSAATLILANYAVSRLMNRCPRLRRWLTGRPVVLVYRGQILPANLVQVRLTEHDLRSAIRKHGHDNLDAIYLAVMEINGQIGVIPMSKVANRA